MRKSEEDDDDLAAEIGERPALAVVIGELDRLPEVRTSHVGQLELGAIASAACGKRERQGKRGEDAR